MAGIDDFTPETWAALGNYIRSVTPIEDLVRQEYPQMAWVMNNPELSPLMRQATTERWDPARLMGAIQKTNWWKNTDAAQREYQRLVAEDPQTAYKKYLEAATGVQSLASRLGVSLSAEVVKSIGTNAAAEGWDANRLTQEVMRQATSYNPRGVGDVNAMVNQVKTRSTDFFMPMSDETAFNWSKNIMSGTATKDGLDTYLRQQAINRFGGDKSIADALAKGATVKDVFDPYVQQTAQLLEVSPAQVDLMDSQWGTMIDGMRSDGSRRPMTLSESATYVRGTDAWKQTNQAAQAAAGLGEQILKTFGEVA
jgi:hypothetical protein